MRDPDFLIIGAQKCGTTSLFHYLDQHPDLDMSIDKEIHFFDIHFNKGLDWYRSQFPKVKPDRITLAGEASPYYIFHPLVPKKIAETYPKMRFIVLLRNPVERAFSQFHHERKINTEPIADIKKALAEEPIRNKNAELILINNIADRHFSHQHHSYIARGMYSQQIRRWLEFFHRDQFLFLKAETFFDEPLAVLSEVYRFLGIREVFPTSLEAKNTNEYSSMPDDLRTYIASFYEVEFEALPALLGEQFRWR